MTRRRLAWLSGLTLAAAGGMVACNKPASPSSDLSSDLAAASSSTSPLALAPTAGRRDVISAVEQSPDARRAPAPSHVQAVARARSAPPPAVAPSPVTPMPAPVVAEAPVQPIDQATPSRRPTPVQPAHQGRYKTEAEVFRDAPFPILP